MSYDNMFIIGEDGGFERNGYRYFHEYARFDTIKREDPSKCFKPSKYFINYNNQDVTKDDYGDNLSVANIKDVIEWLKTLEQRSSIITFLKVLQIMANETDDLLVLHYGH